MNIPITYDNINITNDEYMRLIIIEREYNALVLFLKDHMMTINFVNDDLSYKRGDMIKYIGDNGCFFTNDKHYEITDVLDDGVYVRDNENDNHLLDFEFLEKYFEKLDYIHTAKVGDYLSANLDCAGITRFVEYPIIAVTDRVLRYRDNDNNVRHHIKTSKNLEYKNRFTLIKNNNK